MMRSLLQPLLILFGRIFFKFIMKVNVTGQENLSPERPLIIIANHFSWFEVPLIILHLPYRPTFFAAAELQEQSRILRFLFYPFDIIRVRRGRIDRSAVRSALQVLEQKGVLMIFPEGGIDPELQQDIMNGRIIPLDEGQNSRLSAELIQARPGTAYMAVRSKAHILPVAFLGTEKVLANLAKFRRTPVTMHIGPIFGPLDEQPGLRGSAKRARLDDLGDLMMRKIAALLPPENRGPYAS